ncbi:unnamed protein product, partial [Mesorhabditis belari]|uniref:Major facilitator superfamily (MFS) profile domain-containing protein n=1 Tax=Mesorhabditis belari TaxID=2138241 RepID=A0AAF3EF19_9BILA
MWHCLLQDDGGAELFGSFDLFWNVYLNLWFLGFFIGLWKARWLTDTRGRKSAFVCGCMLNVLGSGMRFFSICPHPIPSLFLLSRLVNAIATGTTYQALILYLQEAPPSACRGAISVLNGFTYSFVSLLGITLGNRSLLGSHLPILSAIPVIVCFILFVAIFFIPETPKYLVLKGRSEEAKRSVLFFHGKTVSPDFTVKALEVEASSCQNVKIPLIDFIRKKHLRVALVLSVIALQQTVSLWPILMSSSFLLKEIGVSEELAEWASSVMALSYAFGTLTSAFIIDKAGRRPLLLTSTIFNILALIVYSILAMFSKSVLAFKYACLFCFVVYGFTYGSGVGPIGRFISTELTRIEMTSSNA